MTPKGHSVIRGRLEIFYDPKGLGDLCCRFDLFVPKGHRIIRGLSDLFYDPEDHDDLFG